MNKQAELTRWTPKRLLSLLMALIMTLSLLPTAALAATSSDGKYKLDVTGAPDQLITGQESADITAKLTLDPSVTMPEDVRLKVTVTPATGTTGTYTIQYNDAGAYVSTLDYLDAGSTPVTGGGSVSADFKLRFDAADTYTVKVEAVKWNSATNAEDGSLVSESIPITVKNAIDKLTADPDNLEAGQPFTVTAITNVDNGNILFKYGSQFETVNVLSMGDGTGYARHTFIAEATASGSGANAISAKIFDVLGVPPAMETTALTVATAATYHTVVFRANGDNVYTLPAPQTVKSGEKAAEPVAPERKGYTFDGWYKDAACTQLYSFSDPVTRNLELYAKWTAPQVTVNFPAAATLPAGVTIFPVGGSMLSSIGREAHFTVKVPDKYNTTDLLVSAGHFGTTYSMLVPVARVETADGVTLYYQFTVTEDLVDPATSELDVTVSNFIEKTFTVMMPTGHFTAQITSVSGTAQAAGTTFANVEHGGSYTFTVTPDEGYTVKRVAVNGATIDKNTDGSYTVPNVTTAQTVEVVVDELPVYIVIYNSNNSQYAFQRVTAGSKATLPADPVVEGYTFGGWYTEQNGAGTQFTTETGITGDITVYAKLTANTYRISYNANTTDPVTNMPTAAQTKTHGFAEKLSETVPAREGYTFLGWGTTANATAASYQPGDMYSVDGDIELFAVWQQKTYTITFSSGEGYSLHSGHGSMTVEHGGNFEFNLIVDRAYAQNDPKVYKNTAGVNSGAPVSPTGTPYTNTDGSKKYHYTLTNVTENIAINVDVRSNTIYTVTFMTNGSIYQTQQVGYNEKATRPVDPVVEGYTFGGWYKESTCDNAWNFVDVPATAGTTAILADTVTKDTTIYAKLTPIKPVITWKTPTATDGYTIAVTGTAPDGTTLSPTNGGTVPYKSTVTFTIKILDGYDASKMQVGVNGVLLAPKDKSTDGKTYTFEFIAKQETEAISVTGIERKTVTIIYNDNGGYGGPVQETVNYYLLNDTNNGEISTTKPTREGYDFLGWAKANDAHAPEYSNPAKTTAPVTTNVANFTSDTVLYAVWQAKETGITLEVSNTIDDTATLKAQYEGEDVTLTATITSGSASVTTGSVQFYRSTDGGTKWTQLDSKVVSGGTAIYKAETSGFKYGGTNTDTYKAVFIPTEGNGYTEITSDTKAVTVKSTAISWKLDTTAAPKIGADANELTIKDKTGTTVDSMVAGQVYTLELPAIYALDEQNTKLTVNKDYSVTWQYRNDKGVWTDYTNSAGGDTTKVDAAYSQYVFRAVVTPVTGATSHFTKAAKYGTGNALEKDQYETVLISEPTTEVDLQKTATALAITGADDEAADVTINGASDVFTDAHLAQFEGQKVTLTATVKDTTTNVGVKSGEVKFFRYVDGTKDELLNTTLISVDSNGVATCEVEISKWTDGKSVTENKDEFYAVYQPNATYNTSDSKADLKAVYIKSTTIQTPIIESKLEGEGGKKATTYGENLTGLLAGVEHTFTLRQTGAAGVSGQTDDWSVVALDGRTVAAKNYTIQWITKTGDNEIVSSVTGSEFKTSDNKVDDEIYVRLNPTGDMKTGADSKKAIIGKKQDVTVTVEASDEINSTPETDVYQLNKITLTATVAAKETSSTMKPTGTVTFYYSVDGTNWTKIGEAKDLAEVTGVMTASIQTNQLPVKAGDNTKQNVEITAVYEGNKTFNASATVNETEKSITAAAGCTTNNKNVTVYSSVVYVKDTVENKTTVVSNKTHESGIYIYAEDDKVLANEGNVNLKLSEVYTLDHATDAADKAHLAYGTDYTVQWQKLTNAAAYPDKAADGTPWTNITSATGTTCQINVEKGAAYRAVITVNDTPIAKGSYEKIDQGTVGTADKNDGRQVYYSNILVAANAPATLTVNVNTDNTSKGYEGIVEGETVTIHTFTSGATGTTPISQLTVNIYPGKPAEVAAATTPVAPVFTAEKANVNGHVSFDWNKDVTPGYYTLKVKATFTNGYDDKEITRTLIVRDNDYKFELSGDNAVYNGKVQGLNVAVQNMGIENALAQKSVVVYYYTDEARTQQVEPTQAGTYYATVRLQESAYWTEKALETTFTIKPRPVEVVDLVAQAKVYDGTTNANIQEIILNDAKVDPATGLPTDGKGIIDGDSVYAVGTGYTSQATAGTAKLGVKDVTLKGDDAANYDLVKPVYTEDFNIQRSQVKGAIVSGRTYKYTGKDIKLAASDIYLIDQAGSQLTDYDVTYYYHNGDGVEKVDAMNKMGKYTVIARPEQDNYKGGATETVYVGTTDNAGTLVTNAVSSLITISNTVELYGAAENKGIVATATNNATVKVEYHVGTVWSDARPTDAGRYLVKVTTSTGDTAYGLYTVVKARPEFTPTTTKANTEYTSGRYDGTVGAGFVSGKSNDTAETYITYTGGTIQGVAYEAPTEVGKYIATVHVGETANYTAHEKQVAFEITPKALTITADSISRQQYGAYPDLTASFKGLATGGVAADTSLRDVQIQPELIDDSNYTNDASDQVGNNYSITAVAALARNYDVSYVKGNMSVTREDPKPYLKIRGMIENSDGATDLAYYGDVIQLYAYGNQSEAGVYNTSSILAWSVGVGDPATITQDGLLTVTGVGDVTVTLKRGIGAQQISTSLTFEAKKQEVKVVVPDQDLVYNGAEQKYDGGKFYAENAKGERITATPYMHDGKVKRTNVGSQIITSWVGDTNATYQSEKYCGLFTINVKDVTVKPTAATVTYGDTLGTPGTLGYSENDTVGGVAALTDGKAVSERDAYINLDVLDGYEILVAGRENENYNVKYVTDQDAPDVEVTAKTLTISTGTLDKQTGMTSGSLNPMGKYPVNGAAIKDPAPAMGPSNVRMYGEPNWVMDETLATLISGDTLADLAALNGQLVSFNYNIGADANVSYTDKSTKLAVSGSTMPDYEVFTNASKMAFKNYNEIYTLGTQNIYQRPVTLSVPSGMTLTAYKPSILDSSNQVKNDVLLNLLLNNLIVSKYNNEGGLAELLKHTIKDLNIQIKSTQVTGDKLTVKIALDNQNYWLNSANEQTFEITLVTEKIVPKYSTLDWTSFSVTMYDAEGKAPVSVNGAVNFYIFKKKDGADLKYSDYKNDPIIRSGPMTPTGSTGQYVASFERLPAGEYAYFAIAQNYTIVE